MRIALIAEDYYPQLEREVVDVLRHAAQLRIVIRSEEHTSELQSQSNLVCRLLLEKKKRNHMDQLRLFLRPPARQRVPMALRPHPRPLALRGSDLDGLVAPRACDRPPARARRSARL